MFKIGSIVFLLAFLRHKFQSVNSDQSCHITEIPRLQIVFVCDYRLPKDYWGQVQYETASHLIDLIKAKFPQSEFSVTGFVDYPESAKPISDQEALKALNITIEDLCYFVAQPPTSDKNKIVEAMKTQLYYTELDNDAAQSVLTAMLLSAVDKKLNWNSGFYHTNKQLVRKIMIPMLSRDVTRVLLNPGNRTVPKADGEDNCGNSLIPTLEQLDDVLWNNQFTVVTSILNSDLLGTDKYLEDVYVKEFASLLIVLYQTFFPGPKPQKWKLNDTVDFKSYAKKIYDIIATEVMMCDWKDPTGYNTLGL